jgi:ribosomal protein S27AE
MKCKKCDQEKPETEFYPRDRTCKVCRRGMVKNNRKQNIDHYRAYDAKRFQDDPRVKARHARYFATDAGKAASDRAAKKFIARNPEKRAAHIKLGNAVRDGRIFKPSTCPKCGATGVRIHGHHEDYSRPLVVEWMCARCHYAEHHHP